MLRTAAALGLLAPALALASSSDWAIHAGPAQSLKILGSEDQRSGFLLGVQRTRPEKRLSVFRTSAWLVLEGYVQITRGGVFEFPSDVTTAFGALALARWQPASRQKPYFYFEVGIGLQASSQTSHDINLPVNFTPTGGFGYVIPNGQGAWQGTLRFMHVSNGGLQSPNRGQNLVQVLVGYRF